MTGIPQNGPLEPSRLWSCVSLLPVPPNLTGGWSECAVVARYQLLWAIQERKHVRRAVEWNTSFISNVHWFLISNSLFSYFGFMKKICNNQERMYRYLLCMQMHDVSRSIFFITSCYAFVLWQDGWGYWWHHQPAVQLWWHLGLYWPCGADAKYSK